MTSETKQRLNGLVKLREDAGDMRDAKTWGDVQEFKDSMPHHAWSALCIQINKQLRKQKPWYDGLEFFTKTNSKRHWNIASRHYTHQLCWSWLLSVSFLSGYKPALFKFSRLSNSWHLRCFWLLNFNFQRQRYDSLIWMARDTKINIHNLSRDL